jgi:Amt family ammonium transporter
MKQFMGTAIVAVYTFVVSFIIFKVVQALTGLRVNEEDESRGLDLSLHGEEAYAESSSA